MKRKIYVKEAEQCPVKAAKRPKGLALTAIEQNILSRRGIENSPSTSSLFQITNTRIHAEPGNE